MANAAVLAPGTPLANPLSGTASEEIAQWFPVDGLAGRSVWRIAFGSCAKQTKPQPIWETVRAAKPDLFLFLGDNLYADARDAQTLRERYAQWQQVASLQSFRKDVPHLAIWDDHDFGDDDVGGEYPLKQLSQQLFCDAWGERSESPRRRRDGVYQSYAVHADGRTLQIILPDLRFNRTALSIDQSKHSGYADMVRQAQQSGNPMSGWYQPTHDPQATLLGANQWAWLERVLQQPADLRIFASSVQFAAEGTGWECWANFPADRARLLGLLKKHRVEHFVCISGDMHYGEMSMLPQDGGYPIWDMTSSGLTETWPIPTPNTRRASSVYADVNFGMLEIDWERRMLNATVRDIQGQARIRQVVALTDLRWSAGAGS